MRLVTLALLAAALPAQDLRFESLDAPDPRPTARVDGTVAYDPPSNRIFLFGGQDSAPRNDLWAFDAGTRRWQQLNPAGEPPPARFGHTLNYDPVGRRLILFGGQSGGFFSDVWAYDIADNRWSQLADNAAGPSRRYGHSGIYDAARRRIVISHGFTDRGRFDDTWAFDLAANRWQDISPADGRPLRRCLHHAVYDPEGQQMLLFGGCASGFGPCPLGDLWSFDLRTNRWQEIQTAKSPEPRLHYGAAFDEPRRRFLLFGGSGAATLNDTWEFDPAVRTWSKLAIPNPPAARQRHQGLYAPAPANTVFFFGGTTDTAKSAELLSLAPVRPVLVNAFSNERGPFAPGTHVTLYGPALPDNPTITVAGLRATVSYASPTQINFRLPEATPLGTAAIAPFDISVPIVERAPGLFPIGFRAGDIIVLYATGANETVPAEVSLRTAAGEAAILFAGPAPGIPGLMQINARPAALDGNRINVTLRIGNAATTAEVTLQEFP